MPGLPPQTSGRGERAESLRCRCTSRLGEGPRETTQAMLPERLEKWHTMVDGVALEGVAVVVRGAINPPIITPQWLLDQGIVGQEDFDRQEVEVISRDLVAFSLGWLTCNATPETLQFSTADPDELLRVRDVALRTLELLSHTPVAALGINRTFHSVTDSIDNFHAIGDTLVPKAFWAEELVLPGTKDVTIQAVRPDLYGGYVQVAVQPSAAVPNAVFVLQNDHFELTRVDAQPEVRAEFTGTPGTVEASPAKNDIAVEILRDRFEDSLRRAERIRARVMAIGARS